MARGQPATSANAEGDTQKSIKRRGANGHGLLEMAFRKTPDTPAVRLTTSHIGCTRFFQVAGNGQALPKAEAGPVCWRLLAIRG